MQINKKYNLLGVWACKHYIEEYYIYQSINISNFDNSTIIIGDFNSNTKWNKKHGSRNHSLVVSELKNIGLESIYHCKYGEQQGSESINTFHLYRHLDRGYHIDHCFCNIDLVKSYRVLFDEKWLDFSDHMPILLEIN